MKHKEVTIKKLENLKIKIIIKKLNIDQIRLNSKLGTKKMNQ